MKHLLLGTDWGEDCDDAVAVRFLARKHRAGEIDLCGIGLNTRFEESVPSLSLVKAITFSFYACDLLPQRRVCLTTLVFLSGESPG